MDPPRRPPRPNQLYRSKTCPGAQPRRRRNREVLEDITWIVNDPLPAHGLGLSIPERTGHGIESVARAADRLRRRSPATMAFDQEEQDHDDAVDDEVEVSRAEATTTYKTLR